VKQIGDQKMQTIINKVSILGTFAAVCMGGSAAQDKPARDNAAIRMMTFNIRNNNLKDGRDNWVFRRDAVAEIFRSHRIDVAGLQEAFRDQIDDLAKRLPAFAWYGVGRDDGKSKGEYAPIFFRRERFALVLKGSFWLSEHPEKTGSKGWDAALPRVTSWVKLREKSTGKEWTVFNAHFDHKGEQAREKSAGVLIRKMPEIARESLIVLLGDFNETPKAAFYRVLTEGDPATKFKVFDARQASATPHQGLDTTWNGFKSPVPGQQIDHIFVGPKVKVHSHQIPDTRLGERFVSDHFPVIADVAAGR
jgi:endonuclease/exonuclease/phosphatase family metal-dependent hydrolase